MMEKELQLPRKILLIESDPALRKILAQNLELYTGSQIIVKRDADDVVDYLKRDGNEADLIISENMAGDEYTILKIYYYVNSQKLGIPIILIGENLKLKGQVEQLDRKDWKSVIKNSAKLLKVTAQEMNDFPVPEFYPIQSALLLALSQSPVDIYHKVNEQYEVWKEQGSSIAIDEAEAIVLAGIRHLYVRELDRLSYVQAISDILVNQLRSQDDPQELITLAGEGFNSSTILLQQTGFSDQALQASSATIAAMEKVVRSSPKLETLMDILTRDQSSIAWRHSLMTAIVTHAMIEKTDWGNKEQASKLTFAAFFHDICIAQDKYASIHSGGELFESSLTAEEKAKVESHAYQACELLQKHPDVPYGAENIILQHHGMPNGIGFPQDHVDNRISPLAIIFRVAEEYVHELLSHEKPDSFLVLKKLGMRYNKGHYQKAVESLRSCHSNLHS